MEFKVDITRPPMAPPNRDVKAGGIFDGGETVESKTRSAAYKHYLNNYGSALDAQKKGMDEQSQNTGD